MLLKSLALAGAAVLALSGPSLAATKPATPAHAAAAKPADTGSTFTAAELKSAVLLSKVAGAKDKFASATLDDAKGNTIGPVKDVMVGKTGMATAIHVDVGAWLGEPSKVVSITAKSVSYIQDKNVLMTKLTMAKVKKFKAVKG